jgi:parvulin-like peptidyl-prolyl isomerase
MYSDFTLLNISMNYGIIMPFSDLPADEQDTVNKQSLTYLINNKVALLQAQARGLYPLSKSYSDQINSTVSQITSTAAQFGLTADDLTQILTEQQASSLLIAAVTKDASVSDSEIKAEYDKEVSSEQQSFTSDASAYEKAKTDGTVIVYKPSGYRYIKHILIAMPSEIASQITTAQGKGDDATVKTLRVQGLAQIQVKAQDVLSKVQSGSDFDTIMTQYGEDADMKQEPAKTTGYELGALSTDDKQTKEAAMALKSVGDISELVPSDFGYYIVKYVGDVPSGPVALDTVKDALKTQLLDAKKSDLWSKALDQWKTELKIEQHPEKIPAATALPTATATK